MMNKFVKNPSRYKPDHLADAQIIRAIGLVPEGYQEQWKGPAGVVPWEHVTLYAEINDSEGIPYCTDEGLEGWAQFVATDQGDSITPDKACQFGEKPTLIDEPDCEMLWDVDRNSMVSRAPVTHLKAGGHRKSLMRVWVQGDKGKDDDD